jgi:hypothetical protein
VVLKAVGVMYLVDLDDSKGLTLTITDERNNEATTHADHAANSTTLSSSVDDNINNKATTANSQSMTTTAAAIAATLATSHATTATITADVEFQAKMKRIVEQARAEMDALAMDHGVVPEKKE